MSEIPCATCCSAPSNKTEKTTSPPPGLTPRSPDVNPPASPTPAPAASSGKDISVPPSSTSRWPRPCRLEPAEHPINHGDARGDIDLLAPCRLKDESLKQCDERPRQRFCVHFARELPFDLSTPYEFGDERAGSINALDHSRTDAFVSQRLRPSVHADSPLQFTRWIRQRARVFADQRLNGLDRVVTLLRDRIEDSLAAVAIVGQSLDDFVFA